MTNGRDRRPEVTRRNYKRKRGMSKGGKIIIWTVIFLLCFFVPFFIIYFGSGKQEPVEMPDTMVETQNEITPEARIYQLEQENEQLRIQIRDLETKLDEISLQNAQLQSEAINGQESTQMPADHPADNNGWEELSTEKSEEVQTAPVTPAPATPTPAEPEEQPDASLFGSNGL